jgi:hypothetical protein
VDYNKVAEDWCQFQILEKVLKTLS